MPSQSRSARQLPRKRGSQNETYRLLPPTRAGEVPPQAAERARRAYVHLDRLNYKAKLQKSSSYHKVFLYPRA